VRAWMRALFLAEPFVDCPFLFWVKQLRSDFQAKENLNDEFLPLASNA
jgi:hypothetical protein